MAAAMSLVAAAFKSVRVASGALRLIARSRAVFATGALGAVFAAGVFMTLPSLGLNERLRARPRLAGRASADWSDMDLFGYLQLSSCRQVRDPEDPSPFATFDELIPVAAEAAWARPSMAMRLTTISLA